MNNQEEDYPSAVKQCVENMPLMTKSLSPFTTILLAGLATSLGVGPGLTALAVPSMRPTPTPQVMPVLYDQDRFFATPVTLAGQKLTFLIDSGGGLSIQQDTVNRLVLTESKLHVDGQDFQAVTLPPLRPQASIPPPTSNGAPFPLLVQPRDDSPAGFITRNIDGLLGQAWLRDRVWTFDYPNRRLLLRSSGDLPPHTPQHTVRLGFQTNAAGKRQTNYPRVEVVVAGRKLDLLLDTGATTNLTPAALREVNDGRPSVRATSFIVQDVFDQWHAQHPEWRIVNQAEGETGEAMIKVPFVTVAGYTVGPVWFTRRSNSAFHDYMSQFMDKQIDGSLGGDALRHFRMTLDYPNAVAVFEEPIVHSMTSAVAPVSAQDTAKLPLNSVLRAELLAMVKSDQDVRQRSIDKPKDPAIDAEMRAIDTRDTARMKQIVAQYGWPSERLVGVDGADAAWALVQHADADPAFQAKCLPLIQAAADRGEASKQDLALLTDRVLLSEGKEQVYGTQFTWRTGKVEPRPLADPAHVDERRKAMGMMPLEEYREMLIKFYKLQDKK